MSRGTLGGPNPSGRTMRDYNVLADGAVVGRISPAAAEDGL
jgi:hypothetical protein